MGNISKLIGSAVGMAIGYIATHLPALAPFLGGDGIAEAITLLISTGIAVYFFPANKPE